MIGNGNGVARALDANWKAWLALLGAAALGAFAYGTAMGLVALPAKVVDLDVRHTARIDSTNAAFRTHEYRAHEILADWTRQMADLRRQNSLIICFRKADFGRVTIEDCLELEEQRGEEGPTRPRDPLLNR